MKFFSRWSFSKKLMAVNIGYILPCAVLIYFVVEDENKNILFNQKELYGVEFQRPLESLLNHVGEYRVQTLNHRNNPADAVATTTQIQQQIERDFAALESANATLGETLQFTTIGLASRKRERAAAQSLRATWNSTLERLDPLKPEASQDQFGQLIADIRLAISHSGDMSNLILDPDLDSYYLMDTAVGLLPRIQDRVQETLTYLATIEGQVEKNGLSEAEKIKLNVLASAIKSDVDRVTDNIQTALVEDRNFQAIVPSFQREVPGSLKDFTSAADAFVASILASNSSPQVIKELKIRNAGDKLSETTLTFWSKVADELEKMITMRIDTYKLERAEALLLTLLAWLPVMIIASMTVSRLNRAFSKSVAKLQSEAALASTSSEHLAAASQTVSSGSTEQAAAIQETGASMSEMASMISRSSTQAVNSQDLARKVKEQTEEGCRVMERMVLAMESIQGANAQLQNISNIIGDISGKTNIINDIVGKTQLLSFNAAIEAARAGQHGRGFAVVAEEVGNLAQTSGNAAKEIRSLIDDSRNQVEHILKSTLDRVVEGKVVTEQAQTIFAKIAKDISHISTQIEGISEASREQQFGVEQIAKAMAQMDQSTQLNNSAALTAARLSDELNHQSQKLTTIAHTVSNLVSGQKIRTARQNDDDHDDEDSGHRGSPMARNDTPDAPKPRKKLITSESLVGNLASRQAELDKPSESPTNAINADDQSFRRAV